MSNRIAYVLESDVNEEGTVTHGVWMVPLERCKDGQRHDFGDNSHGQCKKCGRKFDDNELNASHPMFKKSGVQLRWLERADQNHWTIGLFHLFESAGKSYVGGMALIKPVRNGTHWRVLDKSSWEWTQKFGTLLDILEYCVKNLRNL